MIEKYMEENMFHRSRIHLDKDKGILLQYDNETKDD